MNSVLNLKSVKKITVLVLIILLMTGMIPQEAAAFEYSGEGFATGTASNDPLFGASRVGSGYFFMDTSSGEDSTLYYLSSKGGSRVKIRYAKTANDQIGWTVVFDGNKVYYTVSHVGDEKNIYKVYSINKNGKNKKLLKTFKSSYSRALELVSIHNGRLYYTYSGSKNSKLYSTNLKTGKSGLRCDGFRFDGNSCVEGNGRYLYGWNNDHSAMKIYDCKNMKLTAELEHLHGYTTGTKYLYYYTSDPVTWEYEEVYRALLDGTKKKMVLEADPEWCSLGVEPGKVGYSIWPEGLDATHIECYEYDIATKTTTRIY